MWLDSAQSFLQNVSKSGSISNEYFVPVLSTKTRFESNTSLLNQNEQNQNEWSQVFRSDSMLFHMPQESNTSNTINNIDKSLFISAFLEHKNRLSSTVTHTESIQESTNSFRSDFIEALLSSANINVNVFNMHSIDTSLSVHDLLQASGITSVFSFLKHNTQNQNFVHFEHSDQRNEMSDVVNLLHSKLQTLKANTESRLEVLDPYLDSNTNNSLSTTWDLSPSVLAYVNSTFSNLNKGSHSYQLSNLEFKNLELNNLELNSLKLSNVYLNNVYLKKTQFNGSRLNESQFNESQFNKSRLNEIIENAQLLIENANLLSIRKIEPKHSQLNSLNNTVQNVFQNVVQNKLRNIEDNNILNQVSWINEANNITTDFFVQNILNSAPVSQIPTDTIYENNDSAMLNTITLNHIINPVLNSEQTVSSIQENNHNTSLHNNISHDISHALNNKLNSKVVHQSSKVLNSMAQDLVNNNESQTLSGSVSTIDLHSRNGSTFKINDSISLFELIKSANKSYWIQNRLLLTDVFEISQLSSQMIERNSQFLSHTKVQHDSSDLTKAEMVNIQHHHLYEGLQEINQQLEKSLPKIVETLMSLKYDEPQKPHKHSGKKSKHKSKKSEKTQKSLIKRIYEKNHKELENILITKTNHLILDDVFNMISEQVEASLLLDANSQTVDAHSQTLDTHSKEREIYQPHTAEPKPKETESVLRENSVMNLNTSSIHLAASVNLTNKIWTQVTKTIESDLTEAFMEIIEKNAVTKKNKESIRTEVRRLALEHIDQVFSEDIIQDLHESVMRSVIESSSNKTLDSKPNTNQHTIITLHNYLLNKSHLINESFLSNSRTLKTINDSNVVKTDNTNIRLNHIRSDELTHKENTINTTNLEKTISSTESIENRSVFHLLSATDLVKSLDSLRLQNDVTSELTFNSVLNHFKK